MNNDKLKLPLGKTKNDILVALKKYFGHDKFKSDLQAKAVAAVVQGQYDVFVSLPTGSGKSLCYQLPGVMCENKVTIVFSPLLALIKDQIDHLTKLRIAADTLNSKMSTKERDRVVNDLRAKRTTLRFLYVTPEQAASKTFQGLLGILHAHNKLALFAVDEAHCVSQWGHDFRPDFLKLGTLREQYSQYMWMALTATASGKVRKDIVTQLRLKQPMKQFSMPSFRKNLFYDIVFKNSIEDDFEHLAHFAAQTLGIGKDFDAVPKAKRNCGIIYCRRREDVESVARGISRQGIKAVAYHAGLGTAARTEVQESWVRGDSSIICATNSFGMGVDKATVRFVVHWQLPQSIAAYYQESGRAGRDGLNSHCRLYYAREDAKSIRFLMQKDIREKKAKNAKNVEMAEQTLLQFNRIVDFCESASCRHKLFSDYFGDPTPLCDKQCDVCKNPKKMEKALHAFHCLNMDTTFKSNIELADCSDLYEGGRPGQKRVAAGYSENASDDEGARESHDRNAKKLKRETEQLIQQEFKLRKAIKSAKQLEQEQSTSMTKVKNANCTTKVVGLSNSVRESYLRAVVEALKQNWEEYSGGDKPTTGFKQRDYEGLALNIEYGSFCKTKAVSMYRLSLAKEISRIKKETKENHLLPLLRDFVPKLETNKDSSSNVIGGSSAYYEAKLKDLKDSRPKDVAKKLQEKRTFKHNPLRQTSLAQYIKDNY